MTTMTITIITTTALTTAITTMTTMTITIITTTITVDPATLTAITTITVDPATLTAITMVTPQGKATRDPPPRVSARFKDGRAGAGPRPRPFRSRPEAAAEETRSRTGAAPEGRVQSQAPPAGAAPSASAPGVTHGTAVLHGQAARGTHTHAHTAQPPPLDAAWPRDVAISRTPAPPAAGPTALPEPPAYAGAASRSPR
ncbi:uncharacterized protein [Dipodomys merriami]|uniref:uncharacterized protein n=1 Tax=Dipodomys merriami TaxID=94247 RepID=UPI003855B2CC